MNLVTSGSTAVTLSTCIVGLLLVLPRTNLMEATRFAVLMLRRSQADERRVQPMIATVDHELVEVASGLDLAQEPELVDA